MRAWTSHEPVVAGVSVSASGPLRRQGQDAYDGFLRWLDLPGIMLLHVVILAAVLFHTLTSVQLASQIQEVRLGGQTVPRQLLMAAMTGGLIVASAVVAYLNIEV